MNANKIQSVISSCLRRALSSVAMGTLKSVLDQQRKPTYLSASFLAPSLTPFGFQPHLLPWNMPYLTTNIFFWSNDKWSPTQSSFFIQNQPPAALVCAQVPHTAHHPRAHGSFSTLSLFAKVHHQLLQQHPSHFRCSNQLVMLPK